MVFFFSIAIFQVLPSGGRLVQCIGLSIGDTTTCTTHNTLQGALCVVYFAVFSLIRDFAICYIPK